MKSFFYLLIFGVVCVAMFQCAHTLPESGLEESMNVEDYLFVEKMNFKQKISYQDFFKKDSLFDAHSFDFPVGFPDAIGYYNAQGFGSNGHLGDDWNGTGGGNSDLGDPVYAIANGFVTEAYDAGPGWGNVIRVIHKIGEKKYVESLYAHLDTMLISPEVGIEKGTQIGTIGNADGTYLAHLHLELRDEVSKPLGGGYSSNTEGYLNPSEFIKRNRKVMWRRAR